MFTCISNVLLSAGITCLTITSPSLIKTSSVVSPMTAVWPSVLIFLTWYSVAIAVTVRCRWTGQSSTGPSQEHASTGINIIRTVDRSEVTHSMAPSRLTISDSLGSQYSRSAIHCQAIVSYTASSQLRTIDCKHCVALHCILDLCRRLVSSSYVFTCANEFIYN